MSENMSASKDAIRGGTVPLLFVLILMVACVMLFTSKGGDMEQYAVAIFWLIIGTMLYLWANSQKHFNINQKKLVGDFKNINYIQPSIKHYNPLDAMADVPEDEIAEMLGAAFNSNEYFKEKIKALK